MRREHGFSILEMTVAMAVMLGVTAGIFSVLNPSQGTFQSQTEVSDMQQRMRVGVDRLYKDLVMAGGGAYQGAMSGSLLYTFAPVLPFRSGQVNDDPPQSFFTDHVTVVYMPPTVSQTSLSTKGPSLTSSEIGVNAGPGCPPTDPLCGFTIGMTVMMYDDSGNYDTFTITNIQVGGQLHLQHANQKLTYTGYQPNTTKIVQAANYEYHVNTTTNQLMFYDGSGAADIPVADNVVSMTFRYFGDPQPPQLNGKALSAPTGPWTTYGNKPPALGVQGANPSWPPGENCAFQVVGGQQVSRLPVLGPGGTTNTLVELTAANLTDGPWCPDPTSPNRWDADLLRIRKIMITLRVQAALASLRGPASVLFTNGGTSTGGDKWVPDQQISFSVSPRNMNLGR